MRDLLGDARQRLAGEIDPHAALSEPINADPWIVSSLLQKSVRRGETEIAQRAAVTLLHLKGSAIWRRFMVIAFEDVGVGAIDVVTTIVAASPDAAFRKTCGGDLRVAAYLAALLAEAPKDRSADYLVGAKDHPALADFVQEMSNACVEAQLSFVRDTALALPRRAVAAWFALSRGGEGAWSKGDLERLLGWYRELGLPDDLLTATQIAAARTREPITLMVPLIWLATKGSKDVTVRNCPVPALTMASGVPLYALDEHTRLGRQAIWRFASENAEVRACLERFVLVGQRRRAANVTAFYVDAAPIAKRLQWEQSDTLETFGLERDLLHAGVPAEGIEPLLECMRVNLGHLNELRADILTRSYPVQAAMAGLPGGAQ